MFELFQYDFAVRALIAGITVGVIAPLIGIFLVLRRYSLIADTLAHVSLAGVALGALLGINPIFTALGATLISSIGIEKLRASKRIFGESALALFLSGSLALAIIIFGLAKDTSTNLVSYLFGSIITVTATDITIILGLATLVIITLIAFYKELIFTSFDEEAARVSGIPTRLINTILITLTAFTVSLAIPIVGVLLIAALMVIPVITAQQLKVSFAKTIVYAEIFSIISVISGILLSFHFNLATGGTIVLVMLGFFLGTSLLRKK